MADKKLDNGRDFELVVEIMNASKELYERMESRGEEHPDCLRRLLADTTLLGYMTKENVPEAAAVEMFREELGFSPLGKEHLALLRTQRLIGGLGAALSVIAANSDVERGEEG